MKHFLLFLIIPIACISQNDTTISVVSLENTNVIYRAIDNPIKIAVPGSIEYKVSSQAYLKRIDSIGNYIINPTKISDNEVILNIDARMSDGVIIHEEKKFRIEEIGWGLITINGQNCAKCIVRMTKEELLNSEVGYRLDGYRYPLELTRGHYGAAFGKVKGFTVGVIPDHIKYIENMDEITQIIEVNGTFFNLEAKKMIQGLDSGRQVIISSVNVTGFDKRPGPVIIEIE